MARSCLSWKVTAGLILFIGQVNDPSVEAARGRAVAAYLNRGVDFYPYSIHHSSLKLSTGLATAARTACQLTVSRAMATADKPVSTNTHHSTSMR